MPLAKEDPLDGEETTHDPIICKTHQQSQAADAAFKAGMDFVRDCFFFWRKGS